MMWKLLSLFYLFFTFTIGVYPQSAKDYQFQIVRINGEIYLNIVKYSGTELDPKVPIKFEGYKVISIGERAFSNTNIRSITIPSSIIDVGNSAFYGCKKLTDVIIEDGVKTIGAGAFFGCSSLRYISFPPSIENIGDSCFEFCTRLSKVLLPERVTIISGRTFANCENLNSVKLPSKLRNIEARAFSWCPLLKEIEFPTSLESIGYEAFSPSGLENILMPDSITRLVIFNSFTYTKLNIKSQLILEKLAAR